jgi:hypothetical protein
MDKRLERAFKEAQTLVGPPGMFRRTGGSLSDFLESQRDVSDPRLIGANILEYFCSDDEGRFNGFVPGVKLALAFLDSVLDGPQDPEQRVQCYRDLQLILKQGDAKSVLRWIHSNYQ